MIRKVLGIFAVVTLVCAAAVAYSAPQAAKATGPPAEQSAVQIGVEFDDVAIDIFGTANHGTDVAASDMELWFALFMGADENDGLLKGPRAYALDQLEFRSNPGAATGVDLLGAGKIDAALFMGEEPMAPLREAHVAFIHAPPTTTAGSRGMSA